MEHAATASEGADVDIDVAGAATEEPIRLRR